VLLAGPKRRDDLCSKPMREPKSTKPPSACVRPVPARARVKTARADAADTAFAAGAALGALDALVRAELALAGVWCPQPDAHRVSVWAFLFDMNLMRSLRPT
jgi:hypothetical protein